MKIATWNVNSLRVRLPHVLDWLATHEPDVLALQELKQPDADFPFEAITAAGYHAVCSGQKTYNGTALLTRIPCTDVEKPDFVDEQKRVIAATVNGVRVVNVYVPNGERVDSEKYLYKLKWLNQLHDYLQQALFTDGQLVVLGDFNIAPNDEDVYDPVGWKDSVLCSPEERALLQKILSLGLSDGFRLLPQKPAIYSWWDYRTFAFQGNRGLRIDLILVSSPLASKVQQCWVDTLPRSWERPSDHAPVIIEF